MTKVLLITNTSDFTCDYVVRSLEKIKADYYRLNTDEIGYAIFLSFDFANNVYTLYDRPKELKIDLLTFQSVYFRRPELPRLEDDDLTPDERQFILLEIRQTLEGLYKILRHAYWISDVDAIRKAENKIYQQIVAKEIGFRIPRGIITNNVTSFLSFAANNECIVKPIYSGQIGWPQMKGVVFTSRLCTSPVEEQIELSPSFLQEKIEKKYDVRVTVVGDEVFPARIDSQTNHETQIDWRVGENVLPHESFTLPVKLENLCVELVRRLNLGFGAIDFVETPEDEFVFLEINPNGQWAWIETQTGMPISDTIAKKLVNEPLS